VVAEHLIGGRPILVGRDMLSAETVLPTTDRSAVALVAQPASSALARSLMREFREAGVRADVRVLPDGEAAKTLDVVADLYAWLLELGLSRADAVVAVGGGALTDAAGFAAATYLRGIDAAYVPTTLLGAVDAAIGGKTGVNLGGKNLVGAFRHPVRVTIDVDVLDRLPEDLKRQGAAEALKAGLIGDPELLAVLESDGLRADLEVVVDRAVAVKAKVVEQDFRESGERAHLNYGHTIGHAVEVLAGVPHGHAVAVGMVAAGVASRLEAGFTEEERQRAAVAGLGLPVAAPGIDRSRAAALLALDKKRDGAGTRMVLLEAIGRPRVQHVAAATVEAALEAIGGA
jgi:3-dehydroquinate synthase